MRSYVSIFLVICLLLVQAGCASIVSGKTQDVMIHSRPTGAHILIDGAVSGTTPMVANLVRKQRHTIDISKEGYVKVTRGTTKGFNWWYIANLLFGGVIGLIVDPITGAMFEVKPGEVNVELVADASASSGASAKSEFKITPVPTPVSSAATVPAVTTPKVAEKVIEEKSATGAMEAAASELKETGKASKESDPSKLKWTQKYPDKTAAVTDNTADKN